MTSPRGPQILAVLVLIRATVFAVTMLAGWGAMAGMGGLMGSLGGAWLEGTDAWLPRLLVWGVWAFPWLIGACSVVAVVLLLWAVWEFVAERYNPSMERAVLAAVVSFAPVVDVVWAGVWWSVLQWPCGGDLACF